MKSVPAVSGLLIYSFSCHVKSQKPFEINICCDIVVTEMHISLEHEYGIALKMKNKKCFIKGTPRKFITDDLAGSGLWSRSVSTYSLRLEQL